MTGVTRPGGELGPKGKKVAAVASDWPGLERGGKTEDVALERLLSYLPRYAPVAKLAGMEVAFAAVANVEVVERYPGTGPADSGAGGQTEDVALINETRLLRTLRLS